MSSYAIDNDPEIAAAATNQRCVVPGPRELFLDLDTDEDFVRSEHILRVLNNNGHGAECIDVHASKSGAPHRHMTVTLYRDVTPIERIALQACMGSDPVREVLSLIRIWSGSQYPPTVFFEPISTTPTPKDTP